MRTVIPVTISHYITRSHSHVNYKFHRPFLPPSSSGAQNTVVRYGASVWQRHLQYLNAFFSHLRGLGFNLSMIKPHDRSLRKMVNAAASFGTNYFHSQSAEDMLQPVAHAPPLFSILRAKPKVPRSTHGTRPVHRAQHPSPMTSS